MNRPPMSGKMLHSNVLSLTIIMQIFIIILTLKICKNLTNNRIFYVYTLDTSTYVHMCNVQTYNTHAA